MHAKCPKVAFPVACLVLLHVTNTSALGVPALDKKKSMAICQAEIKQKLISFVKDTYHGAIAGFFRHYDTNGDKGLDEGKGGLDSPLRLQHHVDLPMVRPSREAL